MSKILIQNSMLCANEFALAIALTVFVTITVILTTLLIFLAASKSFRTVFFREKPQKKKSGKKQTQTVALSEPQSTGVDTVPIEPAPKRKQAARKSDAAPEYLNAIPTIPLGGSITAPPPASQRPRASRRAVAEDAVDDIQAQESKGSAYTTRSITITRARSTRGSQSAESNPRNDKKR